MSERRRWTETPLLNERLLEAAAVNAGGADFGTNVACSETHAVATNERAWLGHHQVQVAEWSAELPYPIWFSDASTAFAWRRSRRTLEVQVRIRRPFLSVAAGT